MDLNMEAVGQAMDRVVLWAEAAGGSRGDSWFIHLLPWRIVADLDLPSARVQSDAWRQWQRGKAGPEFSELREASELLAGCGGRLRLLRRADRGTRVEVEIPSTDEPQDWNQLVLTLRRRLESVGRTVPTARVGMRL